MSFTELGIQSPLTGNLRRMGCRQPRPVQAGAIPPILAGQDVIGLSRTGTGNTVAFLAPILQQILPPKPGPRRKGRRSRRHDARLRCLVLCPTRELARQVAGDAERLVRDTPLRVVCAYGKVGMRPQAEAIAKGVDLLVATPGRARDLIRAGSLALDDVRHVVIDEADRMLDFGFLPQVQALLGEVPSPRQTVLFTATMPAAVEELARRFLVEPQRIEVDPHTTPVEHVGQRLLAVHNRDKVPLLLDLIQRDGRRGVIVFCRTKRRAGWVGAALRRHGLAVGVVHGDRTQAQRLRSLERFAEGAVDVIVATDVVSRGLHIPAVRHVVNYDVPSLAEDFVHRIGRAGHGGGSGDAITFLCRADMPAWERIVEATGLIIEMEGEPAEPADETPIKPRDRRRGPKPEPADKPKYRRSKSAKRGAPSKRRSRQSRPIKPGEKPGKGVIKRG
jgi:ATP-dependent RNA helicase RhlE